MKANNYNIEKIIGCLYSRGYTNFINPEELMNIKGKLHKNEYNIYELYEESNSVILYKKEIPKISLLKISTKQELRHQEIMGTIFSLGLKEDTFGDIIKYQGYFYIFVIPQLVEYLKYSLTQINKKSIVLEEVPIHISNNFKIEYKSILYVVSSLRIDNIVSTITNDSRNMVLEKFKNKEIILNYDVDVKPTRIVRENDVFSIRKYGKYKYNGIKKETKKGGYIIEVLQYK